MSAITYYITAHGYGHGTRSCDILNALRQLLPDTKIIIRTDLPLSFFKRRLQGRFDIRPGAFDVGLIQKDSIRVDLEASLQAVQDLYAAKEDLLRQEIDFLEREAVGVVVADIPAIPLEAAVSCGLPALAAGNFGWDWIYEEFAETDARWRPFVKAFRSAYAASTCLLRLPFAEPMSAFPRQLDLPLLAKPGKQQRILLAEKTGADPDKRWVLISFTSLALDSSALEQLNTLTGVELFSVEPLRWPNSRVRCIPRSSACFADIMASMDIVISKPGFGIVSECIANDKPLIYTDRANFREYGYLVRDIKRFCRQTFLPNQELYAGELDRALREIETAPPPPETIPRGGSELAAKTIRDYLRN